MSATLTYPAGAVAVFGGSGGAGSAICRAFAAAGCEIAFTYRSAADTARMLADDLARDVAVSCYALDIADADATAATFAAMTERHGQIHTVVYAAGPKIDIAPIADNTPERFRAIVSAELLGFFHIIRAAVPHLRINHGNIVACVTYANARILHNDGQSAAPKAGIESMVRQIAVEEGHHGLRANAVGLGWLDVGMGALAATDRSNIKDAGGAEMAEYMASIVPLGHRAGRGEELAAAVLFMASQQASFITGQTLMVDGGATV